MVGQYNIYPLTLSFKICIYRTWFNVYFDLKNNILFIIPVGTRRVAFHSIYPITYYFFKFIYFLYNGHIFLIVNRVVA